MLQYKLNQTGPRTAVKFCMKWSMGAAGKFCRCVQIICTIQCWSCTTAADTTSTTTDLTAQTCKIYDLTAHTDTDRLQGGGEDGDIGENNAVSVVKMIAISVWMSVVTHQS